MGLHFATIDIGICVIGLKLIRYVDTVSFCSSHWCKFGAVSLNVTCEIKCKCFELSLGLYLFHSCFRCTYFVVFSASVLSWQENNEI